MNCEAINIPGKRLLGELESRIVEKRKQQKELDAHYGSGRIRITSHMENIGWPELFGYDMNRYLEEPSFCFGQELRQKIFWMDNVDDDTIPDLGMPVGVGMYWDITLFGQQIRHDAIGVPEFLPHPFQQKFDLDLLGRFDFHRTGDMTLLLRKYQKMKKLAETEYEGKVRVCFPFFHRGPLDIYVQLRGYDNFIADVCERPDQLREALLFIADERFRFAKERQEYLGDKELPASTFIGDDWVNIPFISPAIFRDFVVPAYERIKTNEGPVTGFHTCGNIEPIVRELLEVLPEMSYLDVSPWNNVETLDRSVGSKIKFFAQIKNTVCLAGSEEEQRGLLEAIRGVGGHRDIEAHPQAIVKLQPTYDETLDRLNGFMELAKGVLA